jgi:hypothetical protein
VVVLYTIFSDSEYELYNSLCAFFRNFCFNTEELLVADTFKSSGVDSLLSENSIKQDTITRKIIHVPSQLIICIVNSDKLSPRNETTQSKSQKVADTSIANQRRINKWRALPKTSPQWNADRRHFRLISHLSLRKGPGKVRGSLLGGNTN